MKFLFLIGMLTYALFAFNDTSIVVEKEPDRIPSIAIEDASINFTTTLAPKVLTLLRSDLNVLAVFNVDSAIGKTHYNNESTLLANQDKNYVARVQLFQDDDGAINAKLKLFHSSEVVLQKSYRINKQLNYPFMVHAMTFDINSYFQDIPVSWMKQKIIFAREIGSMKSEIAVADYTMSYHQVVLRGGLNIFPHWANKEQSAFYFTSIESRNLVLYRLDLRSGKSKKILTSTGMLVCSDVSEDGTKLLLTMAPNGQPDIYEYDLLSKRLTRITYYKGIDVNGQFLSRNRIAFVSNRLGYPNIFYKTKGKTLVEQLVYYGKNNVSCSSHGDYLVYKSRESSNEFSENTFNLHLISLKTEFIRRLTAVGKNEFPRFSTDGDAVIFIKHLKNESSLGVLRLSKNRSFIFPLKFKNIQSIDW